MFCTTLEAQVSYDSGVHHSGRVHEVIVRIDEDDCCVGGIGAGADMTFEIAYSFRAFL